MNTNDFFNAASQTEDIKLTMNDTANKVLIIDTSYEVAVIETSENCIEIQTEIESDLGTLHPTKIKDFLEANYLGQLTNGARFSLNANDDVVLSEKIDLTNAGFPHISDRIHNLLTTKKTWIDQLTT